MTFSVIIPARYGSSRLAAKPLVPLCGEPMILHVLRRAQKAGAARVLVATDDRRIADVVGAAGGEAIMTRADHVSGTDRIAEVVSAIGLASDAIVINLQGDEPLLPEMLVQTVARALANHPAAGIATVATPLETPAELFSPHVVKVVLNDAGYASYFSRAPIPWVRGVSEKGPALERLPEGTRFLRHIGLYGYRVAVLQKLSDAPVCETERSEALEQLRALSAGIPIHVSVLPGIASHGVDTPEDVTRVEALLRKG